MKGREGKGPPSTDLLVCFPSRAHLTLMPKPICSPARPQDTNKRQHHRRGGSGGGGGGYHNHLLHHYLKKPINRNKVAGHASPVLWAKNKSSYGKEIDEPTSPKVTCAGQIKVKPKASSCKNWQSVMEDIERLHNHRKNKKRATWVEALGFKKDVMQFLTCLRSIRFDFRCFGAFPSSSITSEDEDEDDDGDEEDDYDEFHQQGHHKKQGQQGSKESVRDDHQDSDHSSRTVFSKWFMVLQENNSSTKKKMISNKDINKLIRGKFSHGDHEAETDDEAPCAPPPNALLLMRCRSAPPKSWLEQKQEDDDDVDDNDEDEEENQEKKKREEEEAMEEEKKKEKKENSIVLRCRTDFNKFSSDIAREPWVVGGIKEALSRSRSWKR